ncbi:hypothetical protein RHCRD62_100135 [Rhodococcus sp. RD6.2]|nr:hypothetical protein RHCRD62_100135 [Rhodococcus sp. RD6.2]
MIGLKLCPLNRANRPHRRVRCGRSADRETKALAAALVPMSRQTVRSEWGWTRRSPYHRPLQWRYGS